MRCGIGIRDARCGAHEGAGVIPWFDRIAGLIVVNNHDDAFALLHGFLDGVMYALAVDIVVLSGIGLWNLKAVNDQFDVVSLIAVKPHACGNFFDFVVDAYIDETLLAKAFEEFLIVTFSALDEWCKEQYSSSCVFVDDEFKYLIVSVMDHGFTGEITVGDASACIEESEVVVYLCGGAHGGTRVAVGGVLVNGNDGTETGYLVDIGSHTAAKEASGIGGESVDIAPLSFGKERVESETGLAAAG